MGANRSDNNLLFILRNVLRVQSGTRRLKVLVEGGNCVSGLRIQNLDILAIFV